MYLALSPAGTHPPPKTPKIHSDSCRILHLGEEGWKDSFCAPPRRSVPKYLTLPMICSPWRLLLGFFFFFPLLSSPRDWSVFSKQVFKTTSTDASVKPEQHEEGRRGGSEDGRKENNQKNIKNMLVIFFTLSYVRHAVLSPSINEAGAWRLGLDVTSTSDVWLPRWCNLVGVPVCGEPLMSPLRTPLTRGL